MGFAPGLICKAHDVIRMAVIRALEHDNFFSTRSCSSQSYGGHNRLRTAIGKGEALHPGEFRKEFGGLRRFGRAWT